MPPSGIEPATCRFVAYCLNHYATARPSQDDDTMIKSQRFRRIKRVACMKKRRNIEKLCQNTLGVTKCLGSTPGDNIKVHLQDMVLKDEK